MFYFQTAKGFFAIPLLGKTWGNLPERQRKIVLNKEIFFYLWDILTLIIMSKLEETGAKKDLSYNLRT